MRRLHANLGNAIFDIPIDYGLCRRPPRTVERYRHGSLARIKNETIAADASALRLDDALHRDCGIGRIAARAQHIETGERRHRMRCCRHTVGCHHRRPTGNIKITHLLSRFRHGFCGPFADALLTGRLPACRALMHCPNLPVNSPPEKSIDYGRKLDTVTVSGCSATPTGRYARNRPGGEMVTHATPVRARSYQSLATRRWRGLDDCRHWLCDGANQ